MRTRTITTNVTATSGPFAGQEFPLTTDVRELESMDEAAEFFGGADKVLDRLNKHIEWASREGPKEGPRKALRDGNGPGTPEWDEAVAAYQQATAEYEIGATRSKGAVTQKKAAAIGKNVVELLKAGGSFNIDELIAMAEAEGVTVKKD